MVAGQSGPWLPDVIEEQGMGSKRLRMGMVLALLLAAWPGLAQDGTLPARPEAAPPVPAVAGQMIPPAGQALPADLPPAVELPPTDGQAPGNVAPLPEGESQTTLPEGALPAAEDPVRSALRRPSAEEPAAPTVRVMEDMPIAVLQGLDKITARTTTLELPVGQSTTLGRLGITVRACRKAPPIDTPEAAAFLELREQRQEEGSRDLFSGWMFASSPALSALEHPVYDVWVIDCRNADTRAASSNAP